ncbi:response regulator [Streptomyces alkaliterrae]|uniref:Response regulator n=1 Tax=Streptomyces alkaliterrae TaxID=2213162 RepID=A0A5P0YL18_9ACTN|nr:response regulator [Streptomyces alkaliterrae]MBB1253288.1 response regulator [Streptomyces alkaliterrae]MBB1259588.1 response regulator [Streptomyces alkaliterrae]MQS00986.1 response regulator [Streptomyces alkaliterrae]
MAELRPLADDLPPESQALATALRNLFDGLGISVRRYAARRRRDPGALSRYLNGNRVPPWEVVMDLLTDLAEHSGRPVTPELIEHLRGLHNSAVGAGGSPRHAAELLAQQLADADRTSRRSTARGDVLEEALLDRSHRIADLEVRLSQLEGEWAAERVRADRLEAEWGDARRLRRERDRLTAEVAQLTADLADAQQCREEAEARCALLERQLEIVERNAANPSSSLAAPPAGLRKALPRILIVDDQQPNILALTAVLANLDQELVVASSGRAALKALLDHDDFAVILLDVQMPEMDGYETAAHIKRRRRTRDIPIIFLTAMSANAEHSARGYAAGAVDYIGKPFDPWALRAKVAVFTDLFLERRHNRRSETDRAHQAG